MENTAQSTIVVRTQRGRLAVPIKRRVELCGIASFALHRPVNFSCDGVNPKDWVVSEVRTGMKLNNGPKATIREAIEEAEQAMVRSGGNDPERFEAMIKRICT